MKKYLLFVLTFVGLNLMAQNRPESYNYQRGLEAVQNEKTEEALEYLKHDDSSAPGPVFPKMLVCPSCGKNIQAAHAGRFRCTNCKAIITISDAGAITLG